MKKILIGFGNFIFRWRDTVFTLIFLAALYLITYPQWGVGGYQGDLYTSLAGFVLMLLGQIIRSVTVGFGFVKRSGVKKRIHAEGIMQEGLFAHSRNPLYVGNYLIVTGALFTLNISWYYLIFLPFFYLVYISITLAEEEFLSGKFGQAYQEYKGSVNRYLFGNWSRFPASFANLGFSWKRFLKREYSTVALNFSALFLANLIKFNSRHALAYDSVPACVMGGAILILLLLLVAVKVLTKMGRMEWEEDAPLH